MIEKAKEFANKRHQGQFYGDNRPYHEHLEDVASLARDHKLDDYLIVSAYLHDVIEDCYENPQDGFDEIEKNFNKRIASIVFGVSGFGENRSARTENIISKIINDEDCINIKICDRICNLKSSFGNEKKANMYLKESPKYERVFLNAKPSLLKLYQETLQNLHDYHSKKKLKL